MITEDGIKHRQGKKKRSILWCELQIRLSIGYKPFSPTNIFISNFLFVGLFSASSNFYKSRAATTYIVGQPMYITALRYTLDLQICAMIHLF